MAINSLPKLTKASVTIDFTKTQGWLEQHRGEYTGQWVVLDGDRLIGHGSDPGPIVARARAEGVAIPFVEFVRDESEPFMGGWL